MSRARRELEAALGHTFRDPELLTLALTHPSFAHESVEPDLQFERLEFLGDAVLDFLLAERITRRRPELDQGGMTRLRARLVNARSLSEQARAIGLGRHLRLGRGEARSGGREKTSVLGDAFEALVAAVYLDGGIRAARSLVTRCFGKAVERTAAHSGSDDPKTRLQERLQAGGRPRPTYRVVDVDGPPHRRRFSVELLVEGEVLASAEGGSKKEAERCVAEEALRRLGREL